MKVDQKSLQTRINAPHDRIEAGFADICQSLKQLTVAAEKAYEKSKVERIVARIWASSTLGGVLLIVAKTFEWI